MNEIIVIGTQPPCPRCKLLTEIVTKKSELIGLNAKIRHIPYTSEEAVLYARSIGLVPGTAKDVAKKANIEVDWQEVIASAQAADYSHIEELDPNFKQYEKLFKEVAILDNRLRIFENMAKEVGIMMTPVLIIDGKIMHQGSVPGLSKIGEWLSGLLG